MSNELQQRMRNIAQDVVHKQMIESHLPSEQEADLVTSVLRQWLTYEGHAAILLPHGQRWIKIVHQGERSEVGIGQGSGTSMVLRFLKDRKVDESKLPEILLGLNLRQSAEFTNRAGKRLRLSLDPRERRLQIEEMSEPA